MTFNFLIKVLQTTSLNKGESDEEEEEEVVEEEEKAVKPKQYYVVTLEKVDKDLRKKGQQTHSKSIDYNQHNHHLSSDQEHFLPSQPTLNKNAKRMTVQLNP